MYGPHLDLTPNPQCSDFRPTGSLFSHTPNIMNFIPLDFDKSTDKIVSKERVKADSYFLGSVIY